MSHNQLGRQIYNAVLKRFNNSKPEAILYLRKKRTYYAFLSDNKRRNGLSAEVASLAYKAYNSAEFSMSYYHELDQTVFDDYDPYESNPREEDFH